MSNINNEEPAIEEQELIIATMVTQYKEYDIRNDLTIETDTNRFPDEQGKIQVCEEGGKWFYICV